MNCVICGKRAINSASTDFIIPNRDVNNKINGSAKIVIKNLCSFCGEALLQNMYESAVYTLSQYGMAAEPLNEVNGNGK